MKPVRKKMCIDFKKSRCALHLWAFCSHPLAPPFVCKQTNLELVQIWDMLGGSTGVSTVTDCVFGHLVLDPRLTDAT